VKKSDDDEISDELMAALHAARSTYSEIRERDPNASMARIFFVAMNAASARGRTAAVRLLRNEGHTAEQAEHAVEREIARANGPKDFPILGTTVDFNGLTDLLNATGAEVSEVEAILARLTDRPSHNELRVLVVADSFELAGVRDGLVSQRLPAN
jgi:hypothetical protein